jgi:hypothetical protein
VAEKKFPVGPLPSATLGKGVTECLRPFAESFRLSAKPEFPVVKLRLRLYIKVTNLKPKSYADNLFKDSYFYI